VYIRPKVVGPFPGPCTSGSYVHRAAFFKNVLGSWQLLMSHSLSWPFVSSPNEHIRLPCYHASFLLRFQVAMLKFTGYKLLNNISDSGKAFLIILVSDILLGYVVCLASLLNSTTFLWDVI
jgi:hypothetical protein